MNVEVDFSFSSLLCGFLVLFLVGNCFKKHGSSQVGLNLESLNFAWFFVSIFELKMEGLVKKARASREEQGIGEKPTKFQLAFHGRVIQIARNTNLLSTIKSFAVRRSSISALPLSLSL